MSHVEQYGVRMEMRSGEPIDRPRRVVLEQGEDRRARRDGGSVAAHARLEIFFAVIERFFDPGAMRFKNPAIASNQPGERDGFMRAKRDIPRGAMLAGGGFL